MPADSLHVSQMKGFEPPPSEIVNTPSTMAAASRKAAAAKAKEADPEQSSPDAATAEQEN